jgi:integrase
LALGRPLPTRRERDAAVVLARVERPWEAEQADEMTGDQWAESYLSRMESGKLLTKGGRHYKRSSVDTARTCLRAFRAEFGDHPIGAITRPEAIDWKDRVPASTLPVVITLFELAVSEERIDRNRFRGLSRRVEGRKNERPPSEEEMLLLLDGCDAVGEDYAPLMRSLLTFAAYTGLRPGELFALEWDDIA